MIHSVEALHTTRTILWPVRQISVLVTDVRYQGDAWCSFGSSFSFYAPLSQRDLFPVGKKVRLTFEVTK